MMRFSPASSTAIMARPVGTLVTSSYRVGVDPFGAQGGQQLAAEVVVADAADHAHVGAQPGRGDGLVSALAARREAGRGAERGGARAG